MFSQPIHRSVIPFHALEILNGVAIGFCEIRLVFHAFEGESSRQV
jgi:hypothetical protein